MSSAVGPLRSQPSEAATELAKPDVPAAFVVDHANYQARAVLTGEIRHQLVRDLSGGRTELVPVGDLTRASSGDPDEILETRGTVRLVRPARPRAPGHLIVEPTLPAPPFADAPGELVAALFSLAQETARQIEAKHGACRISADATGPLRLDLYAPERAG